MNGKQKNEILFSNVPENVSWNLFPLRKLLYSIWEWNGRNARVQEFGRISATEPVTEAAVIATPAPAPVATSHSYYVAVQPLHEDENEDEDEVALMFIAMRLWFIFKCVYLKLYLNSTNVIPFPECISFRFCLKGTFFALSLSSDWVWSALCASSTSTCSGIISYLIPLKIFIFNCKRRMFTTPFKCGWSVRVCGIQLYENWQLFTKWITHRHRQPTQILCRHRNFSSWYIL